MKRGRKPKYIKKKPEEYRCYICKKKYGSAHIFKGKDICDKCLDDLYEIYKIHFVVSETSKLSKIIERALTETIKGKYNKALDTATKLSKEEIEDGGYSVG
jgi:hypothetical protein